MGKAAVCPAKTGRAYWCCPFPERTWLPDLGQLRRLACTCCSCWVRLQSRHTPDSDIQGAEPFTLDSSFPDSLTSLCLPSPKTLIPDSPASFCLELVWSNPPSGEGKDGLH